VSWTCDAALHRSTGEMATSKLRGATRAEALAGLDEWIAESALVGDRVAWTLRSPDSAIADEYGGFTVQSA
jgi:hypothetical protein